MRKGALEIEKVVAIILILALLIILIVFAKTKFDVIRDAINGLKLK